MKTVIKIDTFITRFVISPICGVPKVFELYLQFVTLNKH